MISIAIIENDLSFQQAFADFFKTMGGYSVALRLSIMNDATIAGTGTKHPDVFILSIYHKDDLYQLTLLKKHFSKSKVILSINSSDITLTANCLKNHADGIVLKTEGLFIMHTAVHASITNGIYISPTINKRLVEYFFTGEPTAIKITLTDKERSVIHLLRDGLSYKQMAKKLDITAYTVNHHLKKIYKKAGVNSRVQLLAVLRRSTDTIG